MLKKHLSLIVVFTVAIVFLYGPLSSVAAEQFFKGKTIRFIVGFSAGGGFDTYTRAIARHMGKHVPGNPSTFVENMAGAGSLIAANYMYNKAKADGLTVGNFGGPLVLQQAIGNKGAKFDGRKFGWLGEPVRDHTACVFSKASGITNMDKWIASSRPVKMGGTGPGSNTTFAPKVLKETLRLPIQLVVGYKGAAKVRLAIESGEVDGGCWSWQAMRRSTCPC